MEQYIHMLAVDVTLRDPPPPIGAYKCPHIFLGVLPFRDIFFQFFYHGDTRVLIDGLKQQKSTKMILCKTITSAQALMI